MNSVGMNSANNNGRSSMVSVGMGQPSMQSMHPHPAPPSVPTMQRHQPPTPTFTHTQHGGLKDSNHQQMPALMHSTPQYSNMHNMLKTSNVPSALPGLSNGFNSGSIGFNGPPNFQAKPNGTLSSMPMPNF